MEMEKWAVTYTWHTSKEEWNTATEIVRAENISYAIREVDEFLSDRMERKDWSDYWITSVNIVPELH